MRLLTTLVLTLAILALVPSSAEAKKKRRVVYSSEFVVPFTCGNNAADVTSALPGDYAIAIDILGVAEDATFSAQVRLTYPPGGQMPAYTSETVMQTVAGGSALQISCDDLTTGFVFGTPPPATTYVQGMLILTSRSQLRVFATRTATGAAGGISLQTEAVAATRVVGAPSVSEASATVCHAPPGNPANARTLTIGASALPAHLGHGDTEGACAP